MDAATLLVFAFYFGFPLLTSVLGLVLAAWTYRHYGDGAGTGWFALLLIGGAVWNVAHVGSHATTDSAIVAAASLAKLVSVQFTTGAFVVFAGRYTGEEFHRRPLVAGSLVATVVGFALLAVTNPIHSLVLSDVTFSTTPFTYAVKTYGLGFGVPYLVIHVFLIYAVYRLVVHLLSTEREAGGQIVLLLFGISAILGMELAGELGLLPAYGMGHGVYGTSVFLLCMYLAFFGFGLLDVKPVARNTVVENLRDPVLVLDDRVRIVDFNESATHVWPDLPGSVPASFETACPELAAAVTIPPVDGDDTDRVSLTYDDQDRQYSVTVSSVSHDGATDTGWYSVLLRDITELAESRWQLERQNERLDQVASTISHDLRNPINVATGQVELMDVRLDDADLDPDTEAQLRESLAATAGATDRMQEIIDDILTIAREGKTVEDTEVVHLGEVAREAWGNVDTHEATLTVTGERTLQADHSKLLTIFENLLRNAIDHGPDDATIEVGATDDGFYVADDGPGIPTEHRDSVFEYGYTTSEEGTGLGLSIVRTMAEAHGWTVELASETGDSSPHGTRFEFGDIDSASVLGESTAQTPP